ncbi:hypothetical protein [Shewanella septentrionalis]|uniref:Uncharacterized protein n=1 Tax=Shewanella septentrionalis TaxID=2952223 RepID=A0A9X3AT59_9GAMM|nr:hypothetical protein [Shewanella septentrionalis]MCT7944851.1 hypothetical protein [Shewanella septentrionalis]
MKKNPDNVYLFFYLSIILIRRKYLMHFIFILFSLALGFISQPYTDFDNIASITGTLQNTAAAVFTLAGLWIAYAYPQAIAAYTKKEKVSLLVGSKETNRIEKLVLVILSSAFVLIGLLLFNLMTTLFSEAKIFSGNMFFYQGLSISFILYLLLIQLRAILFVMRSNMEFVNDLHDKKTEVEADKDL